MYSDIYAADSGQLILGIPSLPNNTDDIIRKDASKTALLTTQLAFSLTIGTICFLLFCFLRPRWNVMFAPRSRLIRLAPDPLPNTFIGWVITLIKIPESEVLYRVGLDATVLLAFFKMSYKLFAFCGIIALVVLSPIKLNAFLGKDDNNNGDRNSTDPVDPDNPDNHNHIESSEILISYVAFTWLFSFATYYFTFYNYREFSVVRHNYYRKWKDTISARTVMVTVIPENLQTDRDLEIFYNSLDLGQVENATVYRQVRKLRHAIEKRAEYLRKLEESYTQYLGNPCEDPNYDPDLAIKTFKETLSTDDPLAAKDKVATVLSGVKAKRPTIRTGFLGLFGTKVDKIDYYTDLFIRYDQLVKRGRLGAYVSSSVGFVTFKDITSAQLAAQILLQPEPFQCSTELAPEPRDVYWYKLNIRKREMIARDVIVNFLVVLLVFFWAIPNAIIASLLSLNSLKIIFPWLEKLARDNEILKGFIQGTLPTLAVVSLNALMPMFMEAVSKLQGLKSRSAIESSTFSKYFFFLFFTVFLIYTVAGTWLSAIEDIAKNPTGITITLAKNLPRVAPFFINYVVLQGIAIYPIRILMLKDIMMTYVLRVIFAHTPRDFAESSAPRLVDYGQELPPVVLVFVLVLVYSSLTPIILLFGTVYFFFGYICYKYLLLFVYFHPYESAGRLWPKIFLRIMIGLYIFQLLMIGYMSLRKSFYLSASIVPLLVITAIYYYYMNEAYYGSSAFVPLNLLPKKEDQNKSPTNTSDAKSKDSNKNDTPEGSAANTSSNNDENNKKGQGNSQEVLEDDLYYAKPDFYTDYNQPPMTLYNGILNTGLRNYASPALVGALPRLWLPVKRTDKDKEDGGFIRKLLGMNNKTLQSKSAVDSTSDESSNLLLGQSTSYGAASTSEPTSYTAEPEEIVSEVPSEVPSTSFSARQQAMLQKRKSRMSMMADKLGEFAGNNFS